MKMLRRALVIFNPKKPHARELAADVRKFLEAGGVEVAGSKPADALIVVSGDGTLLYHKSRHRLPLFAIGNRRSFICQAHAGNWREKLRRIIRRGFATERRMMLACEVDGKVVEDALNEIVIRSRDHRVIDLEVDAGGRRFAFSADGVLFSTPTGSTAYCYSCGGGELPRHAKKYEIVAIAPYRRAFKPMTVPDSAAAAATTSSPNADLVFDGQFIHRVRPGSRIRVRRSSRSVELVKA